MKTLITLIIILVIGGISFEIISYFHTETFTSKVTGKERITEQSGKDNEQREPMIGVNLSCPC